MRRALRRARAGARARRGVPTRCRRRRLHPLPLPRLGDCPGSLRPTHEIEGDWVIHERIRVRGGEVDESYGLVVQKTGPRLVLVGLTPFGAKAFSVTQIGVEIWSES